MTQEVYMYILKFWQNKHIHEMKAHDHNINPKWEYKFKNVWIIKTKAILAHLMGSNKHSSTNINRFICAHNMFKYKS